MEPRGHHVLIGLFVLLACTAGVVFALWMARSHQQGRVEHYQVVFNEAVRGLSRGSAVLYNGIRIGEVDELKLDPSDLRKAYARIAIDANIPVRHDTQARLVMTGITGMSVIELSGGSPMSPLLGIPMDGSDPIIYATPSPLNQLLAGGDNIMTNVSELIISARSVLSPANVERFEQVLANLDRLMSSLAGQGRRFEGVLDELKAASSEAGETMQKAGVLMDSANNLITQEGATTFEHARRAMASLDKTSAALSRLIQENSAGVASGARGLSELGPTLRALRNTLVSIQEVTRRLEENPTRYLLGRDKIQEFQP